MSVYLQVNKELPVSDSHVELDPKSFINTYFEHKKKAVKCYKLMRKEKPLNEVIYRTPITGRVVSSAEINGESPYTVQGPVIIKGCTLPISRNDGSKSYESRIWVESGLVTAYVSIAAAEAAQTRFKKVHNQDCLIFECEIPSETKYCIGHDTNGFASIVAEQVVFKKEITPEAK